MSERGCYLCGSLNFELQHKGTRDNADINVLRCRNCGLVFLSCSKGNKDYSEGKMHNTTGNYWEEWIDKTNKDDLRRFNLLKKRIRNKYILDFGCGNGGFMRLASKVSKKIEGIELESLARNRLCHEGYRVYKNIEECTNNKYDMIMMFHVLEHLEDPILYLSSFKSHLNKDGLIFIEVPNADDALIKLYDNDAFKKYTYWSYHVKLYNEKTLTMLANIANYSVKWIKQVQRYPISNHLYWLSEGLPGGNKVWSFMEGGGYLTLMRTCCQI